MNWPVKWVDKSKESPFLKKQLEILHEQNVSFKGNYRLKYIREKHVLKERFKKNKEKYDAKKKG